MLVFISCPPWPADFLLAGLPESLLVVVKTLPPMDPMLHRFGFPDLQSPLPRCPSSRGRGVRIPSWGGCSKCGYFSHHIFSPMRQARTWAPTGPTRTVAALGTRAALAIKVD
jgi:hypothetical protein